MSSEFVQKRLSKFVKWVAPDSENRKWIMEQSDTIRKKIINAAKEDEVEIIYTPYGGSFAKKTGLRRHMRGNSEIEGQDIDIPFVVKPKTEDEYQFVNLKNKFYQYVKKAYPDSEIDDSSKSSVKLKLSSNLHFDIVPLRSTSESDKQIIHKAGNDIETSIQKHVDFIKKRTKQSKQIEGNVSFNDCIRLFKWWRYFQQEKNNYLKVPSVIIEMLCAKAFDNCSVENNYVGTFAIWSAYLANFFKNNKNIYFLDYVSAPEISEYSFGIYDPTNNENNFIRNWSQIEIDYLIEWFEEARDICNRIRRAEIDNDENDAVNSFIELFGNPFKNHSS